MVQNAAEIRNPYGSYNMESGNHLYITLLLLHLGTTQYLLIIRVLVNGVEQNQYLTIKSVVFQAKICTTATASLIQDQRIDWENQKNVLMVHICRNKIK